MKRIALALVVAAVLFGAVWASASSLNVLGGTIQEGMDTSLYCTDAIQTIGWGLDDKDGLVYSVRFAPLPAECADTAVFARVYDANDNLLAYGRYYDSVTDPGQNGIVVRFDTPPHADQIEKLQVFVEGGE